MYSFKSKLLYLHETFRWNEEPKMFPYFLPTKCSHWNNKRVLDGDKILWRFSFILTQNVPMERRVQTVFVFSTNEMFLLEQQVGVRWGSKFFANLMLCTCTKRSDGTKSPGCFRIFYQRNVPIGTTSGCQIRIKILFRFNALCLHETFRWNERLGCLCIFYQRNVPVGTKLVLDEGS